MKPIKIVDIKITFSQFRPKGFDTSALRAEISQFILGKIPDSYTYTRIYVKARSSDEAAIKRLDAINYLRGIWCYLIHFNKWPLVLVGRPEPLNSLALGPIHTLHKPDGTLLHGPSFWYEPDYMRPLTLKILGKKWSRLRSKEAKLRRMVSMKRIFATT